MRALNTDTIPDAVTISATLAKKYPGKISSPFPEGSGPIKMND